MGNKALDLSDFIATHKDADYDGLSCPQKSGLICTNPAFFTTDAVMIPCLQLMKLGPSPKTPFWWMTTFFLRRILFFFWTSTSRLLLCIISKEILLIELHWEAFYIPPLYFKHFKVVKRLYKRFKVQFYTWNMVINKKNVLYLDVGDFLWVCIMTGAQISPCFFTCFV